MRQRDFPRQVVIGSSVWSLKFVRHIPGARPGRRVLGLTDDDEKTIFIAQRLTPKQRLATFVHELAHAVEFELKLEIPHNLIYAIDEAIAEMIVENWL